MGQLTLTLVAFTCTPEIRLLWEPGYGRKSGDAFTCDYLKSPYTCYHGDSGATAILQLVSCGDFSDAASVFFISLYFLSHTTKTTVSPREKLNAFKKKKLFISSTGGKKNKEESVHFPELTQSVLQMMLWRPAAVKAAWRSTKNNGAPAALSLHSHTLLYERQQVWLYVNMQWQKKTFIHSLKAARDTEVERVVAMEMIRRLV